MKRQSILTRQAKEDLAAIWAHIASESVRAADRLLDRIDDEVQLLTAFHYRGEVDPRVGGYRRIIVGVYLVFYESDDKHLRVLRVFHASRRIEDLEIIHD